MKIETNLYNDLRTGLFTWGRKMASGEWSYTDLIVLGHPYSVRRPILAFMWFQDPRYINEHTGSVKNGWVLTQFDNFFEFTNKSPHFTKLTDGISGLTVVRPIFDSPKTDKEIDGCIDRAVNNLKNDLVAGIKTMGVGKWR